MRKPRFLPLLLPSTLLFAATVPSAAQTTLRFTPTVGVTSPQAGTMTYWQQLPVAAGFDSVAWKHKYQAGTIIGLSVDVDRPGRLDWSAQITGAFSERRIEDEAGNERSCDCTSSVILSVGLLARSALPLSESMRLVFGLGPELHYIAGDAVSNADGFPPPHVEVSPRVTFGGLGSVGLEADVRPRLGLRLQAGYRYLALRHRSASSGGAPVSFQEEAKQDLIFSLGFVLRPRSAP